MSGKKRILILTAAFGEGHNAAARNLRSAFEQLYPDQSGVVVHDLFADCYGFLNDATKKTYLSLVDFTPSVWDTFYHWLDRSHTLQTFVSSPIWMKRAFKKVLNEVSPDLVISVYPTYNILVRDYFEGQRIPFLNTIVITDSITVNSIWHQAPSDYFFVPNGLTADLLRKRGVKTESLQAFGFPVSPIFSQLEHLFPPAHPKRMLFMVNSRNRSLEVIQTLLKREDLTLTITYGRHTSPKKEVIALCKKEGSRCQVLGWTPEIPRLLRTHHLVLSKAGGATTQEAIAAQCPMIVNQVVPGQEEGNFEILRRYDAGVFADSPEEIGAFVDQAFCNGTERWQQLRRNISRLSKPRASLDIAEFLWSKLQSR